MSHCQLCIFSCQDAFDDDGQAGQAPQPVDIIPGDRRVQAVGWQSVLRAVISLHPKGSNKGKLIQAATIHRSISVLPCPRTD